MTGRQLLEEQTVRSWISLAQVIGLTDDESLLRRFLELNYDYYEVANRQAGITTESPNKEQWVNSELEMLKVSVSELKTFLEKFDKSMSMIKTIAEKAEQEYEKKQFENLPVN